MTDLLDRLPDAAVLQGPSAAGTLDQGSSAPGQSDQHSLDLQLRLAADQKLVDELRQGNFRGPAYDYFVRILAEYGLAVMRSMIRSGSIFDKIAKIGRPVATPLRLPVEGVEDLAAETVASALVEFRRGALVEGKWRSEGGSSLKTYFVGTCILSFSNVYRRYQREWGDHPLVTPSDPAELQEIADSKYVTRSPEETVVDRSLSDWILNHFDATTAKVLVMKFAADLTHAEVAQILNISVRAVEGRIRRARVVLQDHSDGRADRSQTMR
ncbi:RNA polymerase sigma factor [Saccharothrix texasensis]|uniref:RNA polymerase sigma factor n=1 Tax=Saccharothrix texasensis TaxID=103734 RepID=UPI0011CE7073|nr:sigma-70 family RNA polymerase sigma factor [Saccharothrix texasensis]